MTRSLPILILAAGQSLRMRGTDKLSLPVDGIPLLAAQAAKSAAVSDHVFVALPALNHPRAALVAGFPVTGLAAPDAAQGIGATLRNAVAALPPCAAFIVLLADLPDITETDLALLIRARQANPSFRIWRGAGADGAPGHPIIFDASLRPAFAALSGDQGGESIIRAHKAETLLVPLQGNHARRDLDTPEEWARWRAETNR